ncbi:MAG: imidazole glycerol phosphate synthase subunit HisH [Bacteroidia bacterium]
MVTIVDYGVGNIGSIANMLKKIGGDSIITSDPKKISEANKIILCGIGAFDDGMGKLVSMGIVEVLKQKVIQEKTPIMGVCLGMQLFTKGSEEGEKEGLGFIEGYTKKFDFSGISADKNLRIPHMGWNVAQAVKPSRLYENMYPDPRFYFVHSFRVVLENGEDELLQTNYGHSFTSAFEKNNIIGVQFHPEKSHKFGIRLYENFIRNY